jgi:hypothetical protein
MGADLGERLGSALDGQDCFHGDSPLARSGALVAGCQDECAGRS